MMASPQVVAGRVVALRPGGPWRLGRVSVRGAEIEVALDLVAEARVGDVVLVHAGVALCIVHDRCPADDERGG